MVILDYGITYVLQTTISGNHVNKGVFDTYLFVQHMYYAGRGTGVQGSHQFRLLVSLAGANSTSCSYAHNYSCFSYLELIGSDTVCNSIGSCIFIYIPCG